MLCVAFCWHAGMIADRDSQLKRMARSLEARSLALEESQAALAQAQRTPPLPTPPALPATSAPGVHMQQPLHISHRIMVLFRHG